MAAYALVAEFDLQRAALYRKVLDAHGIESILVRDGDSARRVLEHGTAPTLLVTDLSLPQTDGFSLIADLRRLSPPDRTVVLVFSAFADLRAAALERRDDLGILEVGDKKLSYTDVSAAVARALAAVKPPTEPTPPRRDEPEEFLQRILFRTARSFRVPMAVVSVEIGQKHRVQAYANLVEHAGLLHHWPPVQHVINTGEPLFVPDVTKYGSYGIAPDLPHLNLRGFASAPLVTSSQELIGTISILDIQPLALNAQQLDLFVAMSRRVADEICQRYLPEKTPQAHSEEKWAALERLALTDSLTGLSNRRAGEAALDREVARSKRAGTPLSLAMLDLDHFKQVNDKHGHSSGDRVLRDVANILTSAFRASDLAVRWGGDEFLVLLPDVAVGGAAVFAERARTQVATVLLPDGRGITMSAGVVQIRSGEEPQAAIARADGRLYEAKRAGRNRVEVEKAAGLEQFNEEARC